MEDLRWSTMVPLPPGTVALAISILLLYLIAAAGWRARSHGRPLPPGPTSLPFIGNVVHMRLPELWKAHQRLSDSYGWYHAVCLHLTMC